MKNPVLLSSGVIVDRSSVDGLNKVCPVSKELLDTDVYPANFLKSKIVDWQKDRIEKCLEIGEKYK